MESPDSLFARNESATADITELVGGDSGRLTLVSSGILVIAQIEQAAPEMRWWRQAFVHL
jgi:hypothetical protein